MLQHRNLILSSVLLVVLISGFVMVPASAQTITGTVAVGVAPTNIAYDSGTNEIYVSNNGDNTVSVISVATHNVTSTITVGNTPVNLIYDSGNHKIYVANNGDGTISVIDDSTHAVTATIDLNNTSSSPYGLAYDSDTNEIYVAEGTANQVVVIDDTTNTLTSTAIATDTPYGAVYDPNTKEIYVANNIGTVSAISGLTNAVVAITPVGGNASSSGPYGITYNPSTHEIYVTNSNVGTVSTVSDTTHLETNIITVGSVTSTPLSASYDIGTHGMYVSSIGDGTVSAINDTGHVVTETIPIPANPNPSSPYGIVFVPSTNELYIADAANNDVVIIGLTPGTPLGSTTTSVTSSHNPSTFGQSVTFTANVSPSTATGSVTFTIDGTPQLPVTLVGGQASYNTSSLSVGTHNIVVSYSGDTNNAGSTSSTFTQTVNPATVTSLQNKTSVVTVLKSLTPANKEDKGDLNDAIKHLTDSINPSLWQADGIRLNTQGHKVFDDEKNTVQELTEIIKRGKESPAFVGTLQSGISKLVSTDKALASTSIGDAIKASTGYTGKNAKDVHDDILAAQSGMTKAAKITQPDKAIDQYGDVWRQAQDAIQDTKQSTHDDDDDEEDHGDSHQSHSVKDFLDEHHIGHKHH